MDSPGSALKLGMVTYVCNPFDDEISDRPRQIPGSAWPASVACMAKMPVNVRPRVKQRGVTSEIVFIQGNPANACSPSHTEGMVHSTFLGSIENLSRSLLLLMAILCIVSLTVP